MAWTDLVKRREYDARYREKNRERLRSVYKEWADKNREARREYARAYYQANKEQYLARQRAWREKNPEAARAISRRAQRKIRDAAIADGMCPHCLKRKPLEGFRRCEECLEYERHCKRESRAKWAAQRDAGERVCTHCGGRNSTEYRWCHRCRKKHRDVQHSKCPCGEKKPPGREACFSCLSPEEEKLGPRAREALHVMRVNGEWMSLADIAVEIGAATSNAVQRLIMRSGLIGMLEVRVHDSGSHKEYRVRRVS